MITGGRIPSIRDMTSDEYGLRSVEDADMVGLIMSSMMWKKRRLVPMNTLPYMELIFQMINTQNPCKAVATDLIFSEERQIFSDDFLSRRVYRYISEKL